MEATKIEGRVIYHDPSGVGHCSRPVDLSDRQDIIDEISAEIIDGGVESCDDYVASNGLHYSW